MTVSEKTSENILMHMRTIWRPAFETAIKSPLIGLRCLAGEIPKVIGEREHKILAQNNCIGILNIGICHSPGQTLF